MKKIQLSNVGLIGEVDLTASDRIIVPTKILSPGTYSAMSGDITVTNDMIISLVENYNKRLKSSHKKYKDEMGVELKDGKFCGAEAPIIHDHMLLNSNISGRIYGELEVKENNGKAQMWGRLCFLGCENVVPVQDGRWKNTSLGFYLDTLEIEEISMVPYGADPESGIRMNNGATHQNHLSLVKLTESISDINIKINGCQNKKKELQAKLRILSKLDELMITGQLTPAKLSQSMINRITAMEYSSAIDFIALMRVTKPDVHMGVFNKNNLAQASYELSQRVILSDGGKNMSLRDEALMKLKKDRGIDASQSGGEPDNVSNPDLAAIQKQLAELTIKSANADALTAQLKESQEFQVRLKELLESGDVAGATELLKEKVTSEDNPDPTGEPGGEGGGESGDGDKKPDPAKNSAKPGKHGTALAREDVNKELVQLNAEIDNLTKTLVTLSEKAQALTTLCKGNGE